MKTLCITALLLLIPLATLAQDIKLSPMDNGPLMASGLWRVTLRVEGGGLRRARSETYETCKPDEAEAPLSDARAGTFCRYERWRLAATPTRKSAWWAHATCHETSEARDAEAPDGIDSETRITGDLATALTAINHSRTEGLVEITTVTATRLGPCPAGTPDDEMQDEDHTWTRARDLRERR